MSAVAVAILTSLPLRRGSLHLLRWDEHVVLPPKAGPGRLALSEHEVKTRRPLAAPLSPDVVARSEEHTSELQSLMRISYAVFCLKKKTIKQKTRICKIEMQK